MSKLSLEKATELIKSTTTQPHLITHAIAVSSAMGAMAEHYGEDVEYWQAIGMLHDYDYEQHPEEHLKHTAEPLKSAGIDDETINTILSHGYEICSDIKPEKLIDKALYTVDALTGLVSATSKMRPNGILDLEPKSVAKKFKDKSFAAGVDRTVITKGLEMLDMERSLAIEICIKGMKAHAKELGLEGTNA